MKYTDKQLKAALAKMLPNNFFIHTKTKELCRGDENWKWIKILDTELLHLCWLVEEQIIEMNKWSDYEQELDNIGSWRNTHATWEQRTIALAKVKGIV